MIDVRYDPSNGLISIISEGILTAADADLAYKETRMLVNQARAAFGPVRYLVDARKSPVQPRDVMEIAARNGSFLDQPDDRMAVIVSSNLARMQAARLYDSERECAFLSESDALAWLWAD